MSLKEAPDLTRTLVLSLRPLPSDATPEQRADADERYAMLNRLAARLAPDISARLFARQTSLVQVILKNAQTFREAIADILGNRRLGDQVGTLLAGRCSLTSDKVMTREECDEYVSRFDWREVVISPGDREDRQLLNHVKQVVVRIVDDYGRPSERTIGELVDIGFEMGIDEQFAPDKVRSILLRFGMRVDRVEGGIYLSSRNEELNKLFRTSTNPVDWFSVVARSPDVERAKHLVRFAGASTQAILIPKGEWYA
jgi:putative DNA primase/helicase